MKTLVLLLRSSRDTALTVILSHGKSATNSGAFGYASVFRRSDIFFFNFDIFFWDLCKRQKTFFVWLINNTQ